MKLHHKHISIQLIHKKAGFDSIVGLKRVVRGTEKVEIIEISESAVMTSAKFVVALENSRTSHALGLVGGEGTNIAFME